MDEYSEKYEHQRRAMRMNYFTACMHYFFLDISVCFKRVIQLKVDILVSKTNFERKEFKKDLKYSGKI